MAYMHWAVHYNMNTGEWGLDSDSLAHPTEYVWDDQADDWRGPEGNEIKMEPVIEKELRDRLGIPKPSPQMLLDPPKKFDTVEEANEWLERQQIPTTTIVGTTTAG